VDSVERVTADERIAELERINAELRRANHRLARERLGVADSAAGATLDGPARNIPGPVAALTRAGVRVGRFLKAVLLNVLPHGLTVLLVEARSRLKDDDRR
jgi:hypothetical protein